MNNKNVSKAVNAASRSITALSKDNRSAGAALILGGIAAVTMVFSLAVEHIEDAHERKAKKKTGKSRGPNHRIRR